MDLLQLSADPIYLATETTLISVRSLKGLLTLI
jgi:hypothetical protein